MARPVSISPARDRGATKIAGLGEAGLRYDYDGGFEAGLDLLVKGIEAAGP